MVIHKFLALAAIYLRLEACSDAESQNLTAKNPFQPALEQRPRHQTEE